MMKGPAPLQCFIELGLPLIKQQLAADRNGRRASQENKKKSFGVGAPKVRRCAGEYGRLRVLYSTVNTIRL
jgi:hypothetical protein